MRYYELGPFLLIRLIFIRNYALFLTEYSLNLKYKQKYHFLDIKQIALSFSFSLRGYHYCLVF